MPHPLLAKLASLAVSEGVERLKAGSDKRTQDFIAKRDALMDEWWVELVRLLDDHDRRIGGVEQKVEQLRQRLDDHEALGVLVNFIDDAYREPLDERRRMLAHAAAGIANLKLSIAEYARVWRVVRELDPEDLLVLYGLFRVRHSGAVRSYGDLVYRVWEKTRAEALVASGCILLISNSATGTGTWQEATVTNTGLSILRALRSYFALRKPTFDVPGHEVTEDFRSEDEAWAIIRGVPGLYEALLQVAKPFEQAIQYDAPNIAGGAPRDGLARLVVRAMTRQDAEPLARMLKPLGVEFGRPVDRIGLSVHGNQEADEVTVHVEGPHDVLRVLAYDLDAVWG